MPSLHRLTGDLASTAESFTLPRFAQDDGSDVRRLDVRGVYLPRADAPAGPDLATRIHRLEANARLHVPGSYAHTHLMGHAARLRALVQHFPQ